MKNFLFVITFTLIGLSINAQGGLGFCGFNETGLYDIPFDPGFTCMNTQTIPPNADYFWGYNPPGSENPEGCFIKIDNTSNFSFQLKITTEGGETSGGVYNPPTEAIFVLPVEGCRIYYFGLTLEEVVSFEILKIGFEPSNGDCDGEHFINCQ